MCSLQNRNIAFLFVLIRDLVLFTCLEAAFVPRVLEQNGYHRLLNLQSTMNNAICIEFDFQQFTSDFVVISFAYERGTVRI
jgi:hypothetical protein